MKIEWKTCGKIGISIFLLYLAIYYWAGVSSFLGRLLASLVPLFSGFIIAFIIGILLEFYDRSLFKKTKSAMLLKLRRPISATLALLTFLLVIAAIIWLVLPQLIKAVTLLINSLPSAATIIIDALKNGGYITEGIVSALEEVDWAALANQMISMITSGVGNILDIVISTVSSVASAVANALFSIMFALYILFSKDTLKAQLRRLGKNYLPLIWREKLSSAITILSECFHKFIVGQFFEALILGSLCTIGMFILRLPYAPMIGVLIAFTALIPIVGAYIGASVGALMILTVSPIKALVFLIFLVSLQLIEGNFIYPKVVGSSIKLPGIWVLAAVTVFGGLFGVIGMFLGVPLTAAAYRIIRNDLSKREAAEKNI